MRKLVSKVEIATVSPIEGADFLEVVTMVGKSWRVVCKKGDFKPGDVAVYFEIDSFIGIRPELEFLRARCYKKYMNSINEIIEEGFRLKTIKLRGVVSQGLIVPFPTDLIEADENNLAEYFNVRHYDEVNEAMMVQTGVTRCANALGAFPSFIPKTDEERLQNLSEYFTNPEIKDMEFECTHKNDGSSMTVFYSPSNRPDAPFGVCSRNLQLKLDDDGPFVAMAKALDLENKLSALFELDGREIAIQGELVGPKMNGNKDKYTEFKFTVFRIYDITNRKWIDVAKRYRLVQLLELNHVPVVVPSIIHHLTDSEPILEPKILVMDMSIQTEEVINSTRAWFKWFTYLTNMDQFLSFVDSKTINGNPLEGMVWKSVDGSVSFKVINNKYLLKNDD